MFDISTKLATAGPTASTGTTRNANRDSGNSEDAMQHRRPQQQMYDIPTDNSCKIPLHTKKVLIHTFFAH
jgi:hypothetical protein